MPEEFALPERQQELERMLANAGVGLHWLTTDGTILWANQTELDLLGYSADQYIGHYIGEFHPDQHTTRDILGRLRAGEVLRNYQARVTCKNGRIRYLLINSNLPGNGEAVYTQCFTQDVTDRVIAEQALRRSESGIARSFTTAPKASGVWSWIIR